MQTNPANQANAEATPGPSRQEDEPKEQRQAPKQKNRKGRGARTRQSEKIRNFHNEQHYNSRKEANLALRDSYCRFENLDDLLQSLKGVESYGHPTKEVEIQVETAIAATADVTIEYLTDNKVAINPDDRDLISNVLRRQIQAKVARARHGYLPTGMEEKTVTTIASTMNKTLKSMALLVDQVGQFDVDGQRFVPKLAVPDAAADPLPEGWVRSTTTAVTPTGVTETLAYLAQPDDPEGLAFNARQILALPEERCRWVANPIPDVEEMGEQWTRLLNRMVRKCGHAFTTIDFQKPIGTSAQLVGSARNKYVSGEVDAWAQRDLPVAALILGAGFGLGRYQDELPLDSGLKDPWHRRSKTRCCNARVDQVAFYHKLIALNQRKERTATH